MFANPHTISDFLSLRLTDDQLPPGRRLTLLRRYEGRRHPYREERINRATRLARLFALDGFRTVSIEHRQQFTNSLTLDRLFALRQATPRWLHRPSTHYNYVGTQR
jgi:hypothetical protein